MLYEHYKYVDTAFDGVYNRNKVMIIREAYQHSEKLERYHSLYRFTVDYQKYCQERNSVSGFPGPCYCDYFPIDIDGDPNANISDNILSSVKKVIDLVHYLQEIYDFDLIKNAKLFYSGFKGFHIYIPAQVFGGWTPSEDLPKRHKTLAERILIEGSYDPGIYDKNRLFRMVNSIHKKSGLYKIQIEWNILLNESDTIPEKAKQPCEIWQIEVEQNDGLTEVFNSIRIDPKEKSERRDIHKGAATGNRIPSLMRICGSLIRDGLTEEEILDYAIFWNQKNNPPHKEDQIKRTVESAFKQYSDQAEPKGQNQEELLKHVYTMKQAGQKYLEYLKKNKGKMINIGIPEIDKHIRAIFPGQVFGLMARTGTFKTAIKQNILHRCSHEGKKVLLFSLEMPAISIFERAAQMELDLRGEQVQSIFAGTSSFQDSPDEIIDIVNIFNPNFFIVDRARLNIGMMMQFVHAIETNILEDRLDLVAIDFLQRIKEEGRSRVEIVGNIARNIKDFAKEVDLPVILLIQISRDDKHGKGRLNLSSARDSGEIEEGCDFLSGQYMDQADNKKIHFQLIKNRQGDIYINEDPASEYKDEIALIVDRGSLRISPIWENKQPF